MGSLLCRSFDFDVVSLVYFCSSFSPFDDSLVWAACILESDPLSVVLFAITFSHSYQKTQTGWMVTETRPTYILSTGDPL